MTTDVRMDGTYAALVTADEAGDAEALAEIAWFLYGELELARRTPGPGSLAPAAAQPAGAAALPGVSAEAAR